MSQPSTRRPGATCLLLVALIGSMGTLPREARAEMPAAEKQKVEKLIATVAGLKDATFLRNGEEHSAQDAADHMRRKWTSAADRIRTASQFIEHCATRSSISGKPYQIRFKDGRTIESGRFLTEELEKIEAAQPPAQ